MGSRTSIRPIPQPVRWGDSGAGREELFGRRAGRRAGGRVGEPSGEQGYILLAVLFLVVMVLITLAVAAPKVAADIERDREVELMHRGLQFRRAIQLYYRKFGAYPPNMDALEKSNNIRFLRRRYRDPETGKDEWHLIHVGENKAPTAMGFFGQPLLGTTGAAGLGPGGVGQNIGTPIGGNASSTSGTGTGTDPNAAGAAGAPAAGTSGTVTAPGSASTQLGSNSASVFSTSNSASNMTLGGAGVIGVESTSPKATILEYKGKSHFNEWEFTYDPASDRQTISGGAGGIGQPIGGTPTGTLPGAVAPGGGLGNGMNIPNGVNGSPAAPVAPAQPQQ